MKLLNKRYANFKSLGFDRLVNSPTADHYAIYEKVKKQTGKSDLPFTPALPAVYSKQLTTKTFLIVEGNTTLRGVFRYSFYRVYYSRKGAVYDEYGTDLNFVEVIKKAESVCHYYDEKYGKAD